MATDNFRIQQGDQQQSVKPDEQPGRDAMEQLQSFPGAAELEKKERQWQQKQQEMQRQHEMQRQREMQRQQERQRQQQEQQQQQAWGRQSQGVAGRGPQLER